MVFGCSRISSLGLTSVYDPENTTSDGETPSSYAAGGAGGKRAGLAARLTFPAKAYRDLSKQGA